MCGCEPWKGLRGKCGYHRHQRDLEDEARGLPLINWERVDQGLGNHYGW